MSKPGFVEMYFFLSYCKARKKGWNDIKDAMLSALHAHGFDVKDIGGKWCLVAKATGAEEGERQ